MLAGCHHSGLFPIADNITKDLIGVNMEEGLDPGTFRQILQEMVLRRPHIRNSKEVWGALEFEYTFWSKPDNTTAVRQNLINVSWCYLW